MKARRFIEGMVDGVGGVFNLAIGARPWRLEEEGMFEFAAEEWRGRVGGG
jgi:hypothetical protein